MNQAAPSAAAKRLKIALLVVVYAGVITGMAYLSIDKAINSAQAMGQYQIEETRIFQGEQKAKQLKEFMDERTGAEASPSTVDATGETPSQD